MTRQERAELLAFRMLRHRSTAELCAMLENLIVSYYEESPMVRAWIEEELDRRDADAFDAWIACTDPELYARPSAFFLAA